MFKVMVLPLRFHVPLDHGKTNLGRPVVNLQISGIGLQDTPLQNKPPVRRELSRMKQARVGAGE
tara:strand:- start:1590 stop:1781 length:192 start_codon:yes stop_codon:yes gene_type:complete